MECEGKNGREEWEMEREREGENTHGLLLHDGRIVVGLGRGDVEVEVLRFVRAHDVQFASLSCSLAK